MTNHNYQDGQTGQKVSGGTPDLAGLYPEAKTLIEQDDERHQWTKNLKNRQPKRARLMIVLTGCALALAVVATALNIPRLWGAANVGTISASFLLTIVVFGLLMAWVKYVNNALYTFSRSLIHFWLSYLLIISLTLALYQIMRSLGSDLPLVMLSVAVIYASLLSCLVVAMRLRP